MNLKEIQTSISSTKCHTHLHTLPCGHKMLEIPWSSMLLNCCCHAWHGSRWELEVAKRIPADLFGEHKLQFPSSSTEIHEYLPWIMKSSILVSRFKALNKTRTSGKTSSKLLSGSWLLRITFLKLTGQSNSLLEHKNDLFRVQEGCTEIF